MNINLTREIIEVMLSNLRLVKSDEDLEWNRAIDKCVGIVGKVAKDSGWIPVTERMPEEHWKLQETQDYDLEPKISVAIDVYGYMVSDLVKVTVLDEEKRKLFVCDDCTVDGKWSNFGYGSYKVLAWQPLPEP